MNEIEKRIDSVDLRVAIVEREFQNSWAYGSRSEYEERFKGQVISQIAQKIWIVLAAIVTVFGVFATIYLNLSIEQKVAVKSKELFNELNGEISKEIDRIQKSESKRINDILDNFDWR